MTRFGPHLLCLLAVGCTEYDLYDQEDPTVKNDSDPFHDTERPEDTEPPPDEDCEDQTLAGYETSTDGDCENDVETGTFNPVVEWYKPSFSVDPSSNQVMTQPIVCQVTDDNSDGLIDENDTPDIILVSYGSTSYTSGGVLRALSGADGHEHWSKTGAGIQGTGGAACGDIDGDGIAEIVSLTPTGAVAFEHDGSIKWTSSGLSGHIDGVSDVPAISDMNGDGDPEIIAGRAIMNSNGTVIGAGSYGIGGVNNNNVGSCSFAVDIDGDGQQEVVVGNALYRMDGSTIWYNGQQDGYPAVADFDGDGQGEIAVSGNGQMRLQDTDGTVLWTQSIPGAGSSYYGGPPTVADYDGDGEPEIGVASGSRYSVFDPDGSILWQKTTDDSSSGNTGSAVFDFEGDGVAEVVYADQTRLWVFNGVDGSVKLESTEHSNGTWLEYPTIADVDGDGHAEIVVPNTAQYGSYTGIHVFGDADDSWRPGRKIWNQHAYHITNVNDDGTIPARADINWLDYNNFRSGDMTAGDGVSAPDLTLAMGDLCEIDCDEGRVIFWLHAGNQGAVDLEVPATVEIFARRGGSDTLITTLTLPPALEVGWYGESRQIELAAADVAGADAVIFEISSDDLECEERNNDLIWPGPFCE
jgi:hypothetical protein